MSDNGTEITTPVGRIVWGHPCNPQFKTDQQTNQPVLDSNGQKIQQWAFGLAIPRADFEAHMWPAMFAEAAKGYPNGTPQHFSWKYKDGDTGIDRQGKPYREREGYAGCIVLTFTTELAAPNVFKLEGTGYRQMQPNEIKCGDYARVGANLKVNVPKNATHTPGLYVNPMAVEFVGYGTEIKGAFQADPTALFGGQAPALPPGASATPVAAPGGAAMPGMGMAPPPANPTMPGAPAATGFPVAGLPAPGSPPPPPSVTPPAPPAGPQRPTDPSHIHMPGTPQEQWFVNGAWTPAPQQPAPPTLPPPATGFAAGPGAPAPGGMPPMPSPR